MKRLILPLILILFSFTSRAQLIMIDSETGEYQYEDVVTADEISQSQIKERATKWIQAYYKLDDSINIDSTDIHQKNSFKFDWKFIQKNISLELFFDVTIRTKENRYKYKFSNFQVGKKVNDNIDASDLKAYIERFPSKYQIFIEEPIDTEITKAIESLAYFIKNGKLKVDEDDW